jgi:site-specific DNA recombinase
MLNILTSVSQWEREAIGERTKTALRHLKSQGQRYSGESPYGWGYTTIRGEVRLVANHVEQNVVGEICAMSANGYSLRMISDRLACLGLMARNGKPFHPQTLSQIIARDAWFRPR